MFLPVKYYCYPHLTDGKIRSYKVTCQVSLSQAAELGLGFGSLSFGWCSVVRGTVCLYTTLPCSGDSPLDTESRPCDLRPGDHP